MQQFVTIFNMDLKWISCYCWQNTNTICIQNTLSEITNTIVFKKIYSARIIIIYSNQIFLLVFCACIVYPTTFFETKNFSKDFEFFFPTHSFSLACHSMCGSVFLFGKENLLDDSKECVTLTTILNNSSQHQHNTCVRGMSVSSL